MKKQPTYEDILSLFAKTDTKIEQLARAQAETDKQLKAQQVQRDQELKARREERDRELKAQFADTEKRIKALSENLGGIANSQGDVAEDFFANSLAANPKLGNIRFDRIDSNREGYSPSLARKVEFDLLAVNGNSIAVIETKYKASKQALLQLEQAVSCVRETLPEYKKYKVYGGLAALSFDKRLIEQAHKKGFFVLQRKGDAYLADTSQMKAF